MDIGQQLEAHPYRLVVWQFPTGVSVVCTSPYCSLDHPEKSLGIVGRTYVATEYLPKRKYLKIIELGGYVNAERFQLR